MTYRSPSARVRRANRTQHQATCDACGASATLSFRPSRGKPVYCRPCFSVRRHELSSMASENTSTSCTANGQAVGTTSTRGPLFSGMPLKNHNQGGDCPDEHLKSYTESKRRLFLLSWRAGT